MRVPHFIRKAWRSFTKSTFTQTYSTTTLTVPAQTAADGTGADATTPSGAEYTKTNDDVLVNRKLINQIIDILQSAGLAD